MSGPTPAPFPPDSPPAETVPARVGYDRWAEFYDHDDNPLVHLEESRFGELLGAAAGLDVADIGCGTGRHALKLAAAGARVIAMDFSSVMLERARAKPGADRITFIQHDLAQPLPLAAGSFDRVLCCLVLDHIAELNSFFRELRRICRPEGAVLVSVMHPALSLRGVQARFTEPGTGRRILLASQTHQLSDYVMAAVQAGLELAHMSEHAIGSELAARSPRAERYVGWPMLLLMKLMPRGERTTAHA